MNVDVANCEAVPHDKIDEPTSWVTGILVSCEMILITQPFMSDCTSGRNEILFKAWILSGVICCRSVHSAGQLLQAQHGPTREVIIALKSYLSSPF